MLMLGFGGLGFAAFSVGMKVGQIAEAAWWKGKLQEALTSTREPPPPRQMSLVRERRELGESPLRPGSLLRPPPLRRQAGPLASQRVLRGAGQALSDKIETDAPRYAFGTTGIPSEDQAKTVRHSTGAAEISRVTR